MPIITLPDGSQKKFDAPVTVDAVAASIGAGLRKAALAGSVDGRLVDCSFAIAGDAKLRIITAKDPRVSKSCATRPRTCWLTPCRSFIRMRRSLSAR